LVADESHEQYCVSCRLNRTIPDLSKYHNHAYWADIEKAKRRLIYTLLSLKLPVLSKTSSWPSGMMFDFKESDPVSMDTANHHVLTGHHQGIITINIAEADDVYRAMTRKQMNESYRTLLGHFRHESGHYFYHYLVNQQDDYDQFCLIFGDPNSDYQAALLDYYTQGPEINWQDNYISAYASSHPYEDWAECWAHVLHIVDTLETARHFDIIDCNVSFHDFNQWIKCWGQVSVKLNELNRSMGTRDAYPFAIAPSVSSKLLFICQLLARLLPAN
jgi:hypothetical protein